jgi:hypothetical protein
MTECSASVAGGKEILIFCEKVTKDDIQVKRFSRLGLNKCPNGEKFAQSGQSALWAHINPFVHPWE